jgi:hypothetical protein
MRDSEVVAAIVAGHEPADAADAFVIAASKSAGLRDQNRLRWRSPRC